MLPLPNPRYMSFQEWAGYVILEAASNKGIGVPGPDTDWQEWATQVKRADVFGPLTPAPQGYSSWVKWAESVIQVGGS